jgi:iron complex outermembrane recepter protein
LKKLPVVSSLLLSISFASHDAQTQENPSKIVQSDPIRATYLDEVIEVTSNRIKATILETPTTINIITSSDIESSGQREISGILTTIPGVLDDGSGSTYFSFRGTRSSMSEGVAIYLDGRPLNVGRQEYSAINDIPIDIVERIEVIKSPPASVYGANSARGVINIITKTKRQTSEPFQESVSLGFGSWQTYNAFASVFGKKKRWDFGIQANYNRSQGYRDTDPQRTFVNGQVGYEITKGIKLDLEVGWDGSERKSYSPLKFWALSDRERNDPPDKQIGSTYRIRPDEMDHRLWTSGLSLKFDRSNWKIDSAFNYSHYGDLFSYLSYFNNPGNGTAQRGQGSYREDRDENKSNIKTTVGRSFTSGEKLHSVVTAGYDYASAIYNQVRSYPYATSLGIATVNNINKNTLDYSRKTNGIFIGNDLKLGRWGLVAGLRRDFVAYELRNQTPLFVRKDFNKTSWDVSPSYHITAKNNVYFSLGRSYWFPNAHYFTAAMDYNDPQNQPGDLKAEKYFSYELGFKQLVNKNFNFSIALYRLDIDNKYMPYYGQDGSFKGYKHVGNSLHQGIELAADGRPSRWFGYRIGFGWIDAKWNQASAPVSIFGTEPKFDTVSIENISGKKLYRIPDYQYLAGMTFNPTRKLSFTIDLHGYGKQYIDAYNRYRGNAVQLVDIKASYAFNKKMEFYVVGSNVSNAYYESIINTTGARTSDGIPDNLFYPKDGRYLETGIKVRL